MRTLGDLEQVSITSEPDLTPSAYRGAHHHDVRWVHQEPLLVGFPIAEDEPELAVFVICRKTDVDEAARHSTRGKHGLSDGEVGEFGDRIQICHLEIDAGGVGHGHPDHRPVVLDSLREHDYPSLVRSEYIVQY